MKKIYLIAAVIALAAGLATYFFASELKESKVVTDNPSYFQAEA